jgi:hypothetical protein
MLSFSPRVIISHIWTTQGRNVFPIELGSKGHRSSALDIEVEIWFLGSRVTPDHTYGLPMGCRVLKI